ncbi:type VI secretion system baseplate subunit TssG [Vibrio profundum]|uniref:type VI secretion system baseplate subunit TssG n=1 Tax=Vibrio profundum TaxID=2910247 RepID=UPI003D123A65
MASSSRPASVDIASADGDSVDNIASIDTDSADMASADIASVNIASVNIASENIVKRLHKQPSHFSHIQAVRLLRWQYCEEGGDKKRFLQDKLRVRPELSLSFQATELSALEQEGDKYQLTATFMGLYGAASPLPTFYTEELFEEARYDSSESRDFLDIVNQVFFDQYFRAWSKYRLLPQVVEEKNSQVIQRLLCLAGVGEASLDAAAGGDSSLQEYELVRYAGILSQFPRSAQGLEMMVSDAIGAEVYVEELVGKWQSIPCDQQSMLGVNSLCLGEDTYLGTEILDHSGGCTLHVHAHEPEVFLELLPGGGLFNKLQRLVKHYLVEPIDIDMKILPAAKLMAPSVLGQSVGTLLGFDASLGEQCNPVHIPLMASEC